MILSREQLKKMSEKDLREKVLIPLFEKMGFHHVYHYHGQTELGKDIIMWKTDDLDIRENFAIVAKIGRITGNTSGKGSCGEVNFQVQQAFSIKYKDKISGEEQKIHKVWIVTNRKILQQARESISSININKSLRFIEGDDLLKLYKKFMEHPVETILSSAKNVDSLSPNWGLGIQKNKKGTVFFPEPKHANAYIDEPLTVSFCFKKDTTIDGKSISEFFNSPNPFNKPIHFPPDSIESIDASKFLKEGLNIGNAPGHFSVIPIKPRIDQIGISMKNSNSEIFKIENINRVIEANNDKQTIITNGNQNIPFHFTIIENHDSKMNNMSVRIESTGFAVNDTLKYYKFLEAFSQGGELSLFDMGTMQTYILMNLEASEFKTKDKYYMNTLKALVFFQSFAESNFIIPKEGISNEQANGIGIIAGAIKKDSFSIRKFESWPLILNRVKSQKILDSIEDHGYSSYYMTEVLIVHILGVSVNFGNAHMYSEAITLEDTELNKLKEFVPSDKADTIQIVFLPYMKSQFYLFLESQYTLDDSLSEEKIRRIVADSSECRDLIST